MKFIQHNRSGEFNIHYKRVVWESQEITAKRNDDNKKDAEITTEFYGERHSTGKGLDKRVNEFEKINPVKVNGADQDKQKEALLSTIDALITKINSITTKKYPIMLAKLAAFKSRIEAAEAKFNEKLAAIEARRQEGTAPVAKRVADGAPNEASENVDSKFEKFETSLQDLFANHKPSIKISLASNLADTPDKKIAVINNQSEILNKFKTALEGINIKSRYFICSQIVLGNENTASLAGPTTRSQLYFNGNAAQIKQGLLQSIYYIGEKSGHGPLTQGMANALRAGINKKDIVQSPDGYAPAANKKWSSPNDPNNLQVEDIAPPAKAPGKDDGVDSAQDAKKPAEGAESNEAAQYTQIVSIMARLAWIQNRDSSTQLTHELLDEFEKSTKDVKGLIATYKEKNASFLSSNSDKTAKIAQFEKDIGDYESGFSLRRDNVKTRMAREKKAMDLTKRASTEVPVEIEKGQEAQWSAIATDVQKLIKARFGGKKFSITCDRYALSVADDSGTEKGKLGYNEKSKSFSVSGLKSSFALDNIKTPEIAARLLLLQLENNINGSISNVDQRVEAINKQYEKDVEVKNDAKAKTEKAERDTYERPQQEAKTLTAKKNFSEAAKKYMEAAKAAEKVGKIDASKTCLFNAGVQYFTAKDYPQAIVTFNDFMAKSAGDTDKTQFNKAKLYLGFSYYSQGNTDEAKKILSDIEFSKAALAKEDEGVIRSHAKIYQKLFDKPYLPDEKAAAAPSVEEKTTDAAKRRAAEAVEKHNAAEVAKTEAARVAAYEAGQAAKEAAKPQDKKIFDALDVDANKQKMMDANKTLLKGENIAINSVVEKLNLLSKSDASLSINSTTLQSKPGELLDRSNQEELFLRAIIRFQMQQKMPKPDGILKKEQLSALMGDSVAKPAVPAAEKPAAPAAEKPAAPREVATEKVDQGSVKLLTKTLDNINTGKLKGKVTLEGFQKWINSSDLLNILNPKPDALELTLTKPADAPLIVKRIKDAQKAFGMKLPASVQGIFGLKTYEKAINYRSAFGNILSSKPEAAKPANTAEKEPAKNLESFQRKLSDVLKKYNIGKDQISSLAPSDLKDKNLDEAVKNLDDALAAIKPKRMKLLGILSPVLDAKNEKYSVGPMGDTFSLNVFALKDEMVKHINDQILSFVQGGSKENKGEEVAAAKENNEFKNARRAFADGDITINAGGGIIPKEGNDWVDKALKDLNFTTKPKVEAKAAIPVPDAKPKPAPVVREVASGVAQMSEKSWKENEKTYVNESYEKKNAFYQIQNALAVSKKTGKPAELMSSALFSPVILDKQNTDKTFDAIKVTYKGFDDKSKSDEVEFSYGKHTFINLKSFVDYIAENADITSFSKSNNEALKAQAERMAPQKEAIKDISNTMEGKLNALFAKYGKGSDVRGTAIRELKTAFDQSKDNHMAYEINSNHSLFGTNIFATKDGSRVMLEYKGENGNDTKLFLRSIDKAKKITDTPVASGIDEFIAKLTEIAKENGRVDVEKAAPAPAPVAVPPGGPTSQENAPNPLDDRDADNDSKDEDYKRLDAAAGVLYKVAQKNSKNPINDDKKNAPAWNAYLDAEKKVLDSTVAKKEAPYYSSLLHVAQAEARLGKLVDAKAHLSEVIKFFINNLSDPKAEKKRDQAIILHAAILRYEEGNKKK